MRKIICAVMALVLVLALTACNSDNERTVFTSEALTVYRIGRDIRVTSADTGKEYKFLLKRTRRKKSGVVASRTVIQEDSFTITSIGSAWLIETPLTRTFIRW